MVEIEHLRVDYRLDNEEMHRAVGDVSLRVEAGEFFTLLGPSGCGKTSILRAVAGLERPLRGRVRIGDTTVFDADRSIDMPTHRRDLSMVFQSYAVWPHLTVHANVAFPLEVGRVPAAERERRVREALERVGLADIADRAATQLSGGQQQRVAIARGIVRGSPVVLLDEPLSNLDAKLREQMRLELRQLQRRIGVTALYVTHDQEEALSLSDRIAVMNGGAIVEVGTPQELYLRPATRFAAAFLGQAELFEVRRRIKVPGGFEADTDIGRIHVSDEGRRAGQATHLMIRPEALRLHRGVSRSPNSFAGRLVNAVFGGRHVAYTIALDSGRELAVLAPPFDSIAVGAVVTVELPPERLVGVGESACAS